MAKCPRCGKEAPDSSTEWEFAAFHVKLFVCSKCKKTFKAYYRDGELSYTIPKSK
jgi:transposase